MNCECGHFFATNVTLEMRCPRCDRVVLVEPDVVPPKRLGDCFRELMIERVGESNCRCNDAAALLNRWGPERSRVKIKRLVQLVFLAGTNLSEEHVRETILQAIEEYESGKVKIA